MVARPEEENPMQKARSAQEELKKLGRKQLVGAAAARRGDVTAQQARTKQEAEAISRSAGKAFAGARGRQPGGIASLSRLGTLAADTASRRALARTEGATRLQATRKGAEEAEQEVVKFDLEAEKMPEDVELDRQKIIDKLKEIAENSKGALGIGEDENAIATKMESWAVDTNPTQAEWNLMVSNARTDYGVGDWPNRTTDTPIFKNGRVVGFGLGTATGIGI